MATETERKFLVTDNSYRQLAHAHRYITQGYISRRKEGTVRVRIADKRAYLTVKGVTRGISRDEWEFDIPADDARAMLDRVCEGNIIEKNRYLVNWDGLVWEVDEFISPVKMTVAEVELPADLADAELPLPPFVGREVSHDPAYFNSNL